MATPWPQDARGGVVDSRGRPGKIAAAKYGRRKIQQGRSGCLANLQSLVIAEEERFVVAVIKRYANRSADGRAELILAELGLGFARKIGDEVVGVQSVVAQKLIGRSVILVAARLDGRVHRVPGRVAIFSGETIRLDLELFH